MKILVTGFEPFGNETYNPSMEVLKNLPEKIKGADIVKAVLPVVKDESLEKMRQLIETEMPDAILSLGVAGGRNAVTPERTAVNINDFRIPDNGGFQPEDEPIFKDGPDAYFSTLPYRSMIEAIKEKGIPVSLSESAGTFVCNHVFYGTRYYCQRNHPHVLSGFMHIPYAKEQGIKDRPSLPLSDITEAVVAALGAVADALS